MIYFIYFLVSELLIYSYHRLCHLKIFNYLFYGHLEHHKIYNRKRNYSDKFIEPDRLLDYNFFLFLPLTLIISILSLLNGEVIFCLFFISYSFLTGVIHNFQHTNKNLLFLNLHKIHHESVKNNFGIITPIFDLIFFTFRKN